MRCFKYFLFSLVFFLSAFATASSASNAEINSETYHDLEYLYAYGLIDSVILGTKPLGRVEIAKVIVEATRNADLFLVSHADSESIPDAIKFALDRLKKDFRDEISDIASLPSYLKPLRRANLRYSHLNGDSSFLSGIKASQEPFNYNNEGISLKDDSFFLDIAGDARYKSLSFYVNPLFSYYTSDDSDVKLQKGYGKLRLWKFSLLVGKDSIWWGQGRHGSLILSNNAEPFKLIKLSNETPFNLPLLGLFRTDLFVTKLGDERDIPEPFFGGLRFSFKPTPWFEFGLSRTAIAGGEELSALDLGDIGNILIGKNLEPGAKGESNQIAGLDMRIRINPLKAYIYGEAAGEDEAGGLPSKWAYLMGIYFADIFNFDLTIEHANNAFEYSGWYTHGTYTSGYTYKNRVIGHHMGSDAKDIFIGSSSYLTENTRLSLHYDYEERGVSLSNPEIHHEFMLALKQTLLDRIDLTLKSGYLNIKNIENMQGNNGENRLFEFSIASKW